MKNRTSILLVILVMFMFCLSTIMESLVEARGRGVGGFSRGGGGGFSRGGGGFSRRSPAAGGSFSSRSAARQPDRQRSSRQARQQEPRSRNRESGGRDRESGDRDDAREERKERREQGRDDRQERLEKAREDRQDFIEDEWDDHNYYYGGPVYVEEYHVGFSSSSYYVTSPPCKTTVALEGTTYYHCKSAWYTRGTKGGEVVYISVSAPPGY